MNDPVDRLIAEREAADTSFRGSLVFSVVAHIVLVGGAFAAQFVLPKPPLIRVVDGIAVPLPPGGDGRPSAEAPTSSPEAQAPEPPAPKVEPPPKVLKPPKEEPRTKGLPAPDAKKGKIKPEPAPAARGGGVPEGKGVSTQTPGLEFGPPGPGVPEGTDPLGDWYLAGVQRKIWGVWKEQNPGGVTQPITIAFTILADGSVTDVNVTQSSGAKLLDLAAQRAIYSAAPFGPLPKDYGTNRVTIQAIFKPTS